MRERSVLSGYERYKKSTSCGWKYFFYGFMIFFNDAHCSEVCALYLVTGTNLCAGCNEYKTDLWKRLSRCADYILSKCS